jgi:hypothetical protein
MAADGFPIPSPMFPQDDRKSADTKYEYPWFNHDSTGNHYDPQKNLSK